MGIPRRAFHFVAQAELLLINRGLAKLAAFLHTAANCAWRQNGCCEIRKTLRLQRGYTGK
jgi:hypothetical protein